MFQFNFGKETNAKDDVEKPEIKWLESKEIVLNHNLINEILQHKHLEYNTLELNDITIQFISPKSIINLKENDINSDIIKAESNHSDLITGIYEGGLKIWECTYDLANFICENHFCFEGKNVLDLGCGMGIIGIMVLLKGAIVDFQDYNSDVIQYLTILNVFLTTENKESLLKKSRFYSGDWKSFSDIILSSDGQCKYDYILTSETIYNTSNYKKLIDLFKCLLKPDGKIYLAAKTYYFGVGGGLRQFEDSLKEIGCFNYSTVWKCDEGINREILEITMK